jgi:hypothetical protein
MDIKAEALVSKSLIRIVQPPAWCLACTIPQAISIYLKHLMAHLERHWVLPKLHQLYMAWDGNLTHPQLMTLESLDRVCAVRMQFTEKKCRKLAMGSVDFSPQVDLA